MLIVERAEKGEGLSYPEPSATEIGCAKEDLADELIDHWDEIRAALTATPAQATPSGELDGLVAEIDALFEKMQKAAASYIEPTTYTARHPHGEKNAWNTEFPEPEEHDSPQNASQKKKRRDEAFISDIIYMLDGPEQRQAQAQTIGGEDVRERVNEAVTQAYRVGVTAEDLTAKQASDRLDTITHAILTALEPAPQADEELTTLRAKCEEMREALRPFAKIGYKDRHLGAVAPRCDRETETVTVQLRFLRRARKALADHGGVK